MATNASARRKQRVGNTLSDAIIQLRDVSKSFGAHTVLDGISFDVPRGAVTYVMGPSGTGKSVLLKNIIGLLKPERGQIWIDGQDIVRISERELYRVRMKMGVLFQDGALFGSMNLFDNIAFPLREHTKYSEKEIREIVMDKADLVGLSSHLDKFPGEISGGMKKRGGLARALVLDPEIVLFDEPDSGLDPVRVSYLDDLMLKTKAETNATFVVISHNIESTRRVADYMGILFRSNLAAFGSKDDLFASEDPVVYQFLGGGTSGPIGMDETADAEAEIAQELDISRDEALAYTAETAPSERAPVSTPAVSTPASSGAPTLTAEQEPAPVGDWSTTPPEVG